MKALVLVAGGDAMLEKAAQQVLEGAREAGAEVDLLHPGSSLSIEGYQLVLLGISAYGLSRRMEALSLLASPKNNLENRQVRVFCVHSGPGKNALEDAKKLLEERKAVFGGSVLLDAKGLLKHFGKGSLSEGELARAKAFGERGASHFLGRRPHLPNEKLQIPGYRK